jgi:hypothetical protein
MLRAEMDPKFLNDLTKRTKRLAALFDPDRERQAWARLLAEVVRRTRV